MKLYFEISFYPFIYSCLYLFYLSLQPNYPRLSKACNLARNGGDVQDSWESVQGIINQYAKNDGDFVSVAGPGFWNDPDMVRI